MFDEFQQIGKYPEENIEAVLRSVIQEYPAVPYIFSGSSKHMLENMFMSPGKPFYQSSELMYLDRIDAKDYRAFIKDLLIRLVLLLPLIYLTNTGKDISGQMINLIANLSNNVLYL